jgi:ABC-type multidrug transport system fused ATPase/permease subunit
VKSWPSLRPYLAPHATVVAAASLLLIGHSALTLALPRLLGDLVDLDARGHAGGAVSSVLLLLIAIGLARYVVEAAVLHLLGCAAGRFVRALRSDLHRRLMAAPLGFHSERAVGELTSRLVNDVSLLHALLASLLAQLLKSLLLLVGGIALLALTDARLTMWLILLILPVAAVIRVAGRRLHAAAADVQSRLGDVSALASEHLHTIHTIKGLGSEAAAQTALDRQLDGLYEEAQRRVRIQVVAQPAIAALALAAFIAVTWLGGGALVTGRLTPAVLATCLVYAGIVAMAGNAVATLYGELQQARAAADRVAALLHAPVEPIAQPAVFPAPFRGGVEFVDVDFAYADVPVLDNVSFEVPPAETVAFLGANGSGKSSILKLALGLYRPTGGRILVDGVDLARINVRELRARTGYLPQDPVLFRGTIRSNLLFGLPAPPRLRAVDDAVDAVGLRAVIRVLPAGYDTAVGEGGVTLSTGQRARLALARLLLRDPRLILLDEPTAALDEDVVSLVEAIVRDRLAGRTILLVTHEPRLYALASQVIGLRGGCVEREPAAGQPDPR